jgi:hypothetical protein
MITHRHLFLDLEDTIITPVTDGWFNTHCINVEKVKAIIADWKPTQVHLFSFALWDTSQLVRFNMGTREHLEKALGIKFDTAWTVDDNIIPMCCQVMGLGQGSVTFQDMGEFWSKHQAFRLCMMHKFKGAWSTWQHENDVLLLDDMVINETFHWPDLHVRGTVANIDNLPEPWNALNRPDPS